MNPDLALALRLADAADIISMRHFLDVDLAVESKPDSTPVTLADRGVEVFLVSPQPEANTAALAAKCDAPMRFMTDRGNRAAAALGIVEKAGVPAGMQMLGYDSDVPRPTVFITAKDGTILYCDLSENYRVRPEPAQYFEVLDRFAIA